jgi:hypothetical protein
MGKDKPISRREMLTWFGPSAVRRLAEAMAARDPEEAGKRLGRSARKRPWQTETAPRREDDTDESHE